MEEVVEITRTELAAALKQWEIDSKANGWTERDDAERHVDAADYLIHTIRLNRGEGEAPKQS